jgi:hypothetical protein
MQFVARACPEEGRVIPGLGSQLLAALEKDVLGEKSAG